jgi:hypothetical protein
MFVSLGKLSRFPLLSVQGALGAGQVCRRARERAVIPRGARPLLLLDRLFPNSLP